MEIKTFEPYAGGGAGVWVQRSSHGSHNPLPEHGHDFIELIYVVHGSGRHLINKEVYSLRSGDLYAVMPGEMHAFPDTAVQELEIINCLFQAETLRPMLHSEPQELLSLPYLAPLSQAGGRLPRRLLLSSGDSSVLIGLLEQMMSELREGAPGSRVLVRQRLLEMLILLSRLELKEAAGRQGVPFHVRQQTGSHEILVRKIQAYLETHYHQRITAARLAEVFAISTRHLHRIFRQETGRSLNETLQGIRMERAKHMLNESTRSVEGISAAVGFSDPSAFSKLFSRAVGCTPGEFRRHTRIRRAACLN